MTDVSGNYTADILFYLALFLALLLFIISAITWDNYRDYQYRVMDADKARKARIFAGILFAFALLAIITALVLYIMFPPDKVRIKTIYSKPDTKNIIVYPAQTPSGLYTSQSSKAICKDRCESGPCAPNLTLGDILGSTITPPGCDPCNTKQNISPPTQNRFINAERQNPLLLPRS